MCSFDVCSLFTNVPLEETISICDEALNNNPDSQPYFPEDVFIELMHGATSMVEFSFDIIYKQIDEVATWTCAGQIHYLSKKISKKQAILRSVNYTEDYLV